jgi:chemotaxis protein CheZ
MDGNSTNGLSETVRTAIQSEVGCLFDGLQKFLDRRIAELSSEIHATVQMVNFSETNITGRLEEMHTQIAHITALPQMTSRNSGIELEAVVQATEDAANRILGAAESIHALLTERFADHPASPAIITQIDAIFEACSFQDLTGQRIRRAIQQLQNIEGSLAQIVEQRQPESQAVVPAAPVDGIKVSGPDLHQTEIDRLIGA